MGEANMENHCNKLCSDGRAFPRARAPLFRVTKVLSIYLYILKFPRSKFCFAFPQQETFLHFENLSAFQRTKKTLFV